MNLLTITIIANIVCLIAGTFIVYRNIKHMRNTMSDYASLMYETMKRTDDASKTALDIENAIDTVDDNVKSLTSSIRSLVKQQQAKSKEKILPGPQLLEMIDKCIVENVAMMAVLIQKQRVPDDPLTRVTEITVLTFPFVEEKYLVDRCIYIMEQFNQSQTGQKSR